jgi:hypothetical protein
VLLAINGSAAQARGGHSPRASNPSLSAIFFPKKMANEAARLLSYERLFVKFYLRKNRKKVDNQRKMILKSCFCLAPIRVL